MTLVAAVIADDPDGGVVAVTFALFNGDEGLLLTSVTVPMPVTVRADPSDLPVMVSSLVVSLKDAEMPAASRVELLVMADAASSPVSPLMLTLVPLMLSAELVP